MRLDALLQKKRNDVIALAAKHGAEKCKGFWSVARVETSPESDIDFLVKMEEGRD
jgi:predicted nucleotidyltransferase